MMVDYLDSLVPAERRMFPTTEPGRHWALKVAALATGLADKSGFFGRDQAAKSLAAVHHEYRR